jgi:sec-independent protein translocase protein TatA
MLGMPEIVIIILVVIILLFGAKKLPELARSLGRAKGEFERGKMEIEKELKEEKAKEPKKEDKDVVRAAKELGIDTEGKSEEQLKEEIAKKMKET